nr:uncharacterized protein LOC121832207 isoform X1 [Peromyscus maniculatus bairdii]
MMGQAQARTKKRDASLICWNSGKFYSNREEAKPRGCTDLCRSVLMKPRTEHGRKAVHAGQKATLDPLELELQTIVSHHEGSGNQTLGRLQEQRMLLTAEPSRWTPKTKSHHRFEQIWTFWHFNDNTKMDSHSGKLSKIQPVLDYFFHKFRTIYKPKQQLSLDEGMSPWRGRLKFPTYNLVEITIMVDLFGWCVGVTPALSVIWRYTLLKERLQETLLSALGPCLGIWHHVYQDNYYNINYIYC